MNRFQYASPTSLEDAVGLLAERWGQTEVLAGGTDLITSLKQNLTAPKLLVSLRAVPGLDRIERDGEALHIGAMVRLSDLAGHPEARRRLPSLVTAAEGVGSPQIMAMGTVAGDLCQRPRCWYYRQGFGLLGRHNGQPLIPDGQNRYHAIFGNEGPAYFVHPSSLAPPLIALGAELTIAGPGGDSRQMKVADFFRTPRSESERETVLKPNEVLTRITIPGGDRANATYEVRQRQVLDWPLVTASVAFADAANAARARVVLGHVAPVPWVSERAAAVLEGQRIDAALAARAGDAAAEGATPLSGNGYKVHLVRTAVKRAVLRAAGIEEA